MRQAAKRGNQNPFARDRRMTRGRPPTPGHEIWMYARGKVSESGTSGVFIIALCLDACSMESQSSMALTGGLQQPCSSVG